MSQLQIDIVTPKGVVYSGDAISCTAPGVDGEFQILFQHAALLSHLDVGEIRIQFSDGEKSMATSGGLLEVKENRVSVIVETAEWAADIDVERAKAAKERAEQRLKEKEGIDVPRAKLALARALNRIHISSRA